MWWPLAARATTAGPPKGEPDIEASLGSVEMRGTSDDDGHGNRTSCTLKHFPKLTVDEYRALSRDEQEALKASEVSKLDEEYSNLRDELKQKIKDFDDGDAIQPHTDEGGKAYYIGDAYNPINPVFAAEWEVHELDHYPYLRYLKRLSRTRTHLEYLAHWMEVSCAPPKWKYLRTLKENVAARVRRANVCVLDYSDRHLTSSDTFTDVPSLKALLDQHPQTMPSRQIRLLVVEDLSRDLVDMLGAYYDIDPLFFLSHIDDYLFHHTRDRWAKLPNLDVEARNMTHFNLQYLRARYFETEGDFTAAEKESGLFNVLRRLDSDRSRKQLQGSLLDQKAASVTLTRAKTSLWIQPRGQNDPVTAILLVDPTVDTGSPLWGHGYRPFGPTPSMASLNRTEDLDAPGRTTLFEDIIYWGRKMTSDDLKLVLQDERCIAMSMYKMVLSDWLTVLKYMTTMLGILEWEFAKPHWGEKTSDIDSLLKRLAPWRRNAGYYEAMIGEAIACLFSHSVRPPLHSSHASGGVTEAHLQHLLTGHHCSKSCTGIDSLWTDFQNVKLQMEEVKARIKRIEATATNAINIEESRRAVKQNKNLARLTFLATTFIPLNFTTSFLSMSPDFASAKQTIWLFFVLGVPLTFVAFIIVDLTHPEKDGYIHKYWRRKFHHEGPKPARPTSSTGDQREERRTARTPSPAKRTTTIDWFKPANGSTSGRRD